jgi:hypothetical protein
MPPTFIDDEEFSALPFMYESRLSDICLARMIALISPEPRRAFADRVLANFSKPCTGET